MTIMWWGKRKWTQDRPNVCLHQKCAWILPCLFFLHGCNHRTCSLAGSTVGRGNEDVLSLMIQHATLVATWAPRVDSRWTFSSLPCSLGRTPLCRAACESPLGTWAVTMCSPPLHAGTQVAWGRVWASVFSKLCVVLTCSQGREPLLWENFCAFSPCKLTPCPAVFCWREVLLPPGREVEEIPVNWSQGCNFLSLWWIFPLL